ncbi:MAG: hypothetical protein ACRD4O_13405 [Bryobacteraceae bacterium]
MQNELAERWCLFVPREKALFLAGAEQFFTQSFRAFPSAQNEMGDACKAYALEIPNACVHHCMGVLQSGLHALADYLKVPLSGQIELENWKNIIDQIEAHIRRLESLPKGTAKDERLQLCSEAALQFRYFKDAWRNHVEHHRATYDETQAHGVLIHVRDFMERLAAGGISS